MWRADELGQISWGQTGVSNFAQRNLSAAAVPRLCPSSPFPHFARRFQAGIHSLSLLSPGSAVSLYTSYSVEKRGGEIYVFPWEGSPLLSDQVQLPPPLHHPVAESVSSEKAFDLPASQPRGNQPAEQTSEGG